jgi:hypothetical protein
LCVLVLFAILVKNVLGLRKNVLGLRAVARGASAGAGPALVDRLGRRRRRFAALGFPPADLVRNLDFSISVMAANPHSQTPRAIRAVANAEECGAEAPFRKTNSRGAGGGVLRSSTIWQNELPPSWMGVALRHQLEKRTGCRRRRAATRDCPAEFVLNLYFQFPILSGVAGHGDNRISGIEFGKTNSGCRSFMPTPDIAQVA